MLGRNKKIIIDIDVANAKIRASKPDNQKLPMPNDDVGKMIFFNTVDSDRLNKKTFGTLQGKALKEACRICEKEQKRSKMLEHFEKHFIQQKEVPITAQEIMNLVVPQIEK